MGGSGELDARGEGFGDYTHPPKWDAGSMVILMVVVAWREMDRGSGMVKTTMVVLCLMTTTQRGLQLQNGA